MQMRRKALRLGDLLVENKIITSEQLQQALAHQRTTGVKLGEALVALELVPEQELNQILAQQRRKLRIGDQMVAEGLIDVEQLQRALDEQKRTGKKLGETLVNLGIVSEQQFLEFLSELLEIPLLDLHSYALKPELVKRLPESVARRHRAIVVTEGKDGLLVGMVDPTDIFAFDEISRVLKRAPRVAMVGQKDLLRSIDLTYRRTEEILEHAEALSEEVGRPAVNLDQLVQNEMMVDAPVVRVLQSLFDDAVSLNASDIHIEPDENVLRIRLRVDGVLQETLLKEQSHIAPALVSKLKVMAGLEIAERRRPQDGRFHMMVRKRTIDVRISTLPIQHGESVVMRLLDQSAATFQLEKLGMPSKILERFRNLLHRPHGLVLVTGPTGSGKTTTLYAALNELNSPAKKIISVEDPVEYRLPRINQVQVRSQIDLTFARVLRAVLRQDPDVVLVGEMRDQETADIAIRAALTGHLVLSTLHTNDAVSTATRLMDMGVEGYVVEAALLGILAQRLVRRNCTACQAHYIPPPSERAVLHGLLGEKAGLVQRLYRSQGCTHCQHSGYSGRIAAVELLEIHPQLGEALRSNDTTAFRRLVLQNPGYRPLHYSALEYALRGITTLDEVMRLNSNLAVPGIPSSNLSTRPEATAGTGAPPRDGKAPEQQAQV